MIQKETYLKYERDKFFTKVLIENSNLLTNTKHSRSLTRVGVGSYGDSCSPFLLWTISFYNLGTLVQY